MTERFDITPDRWPDVSRVFSAAVGLEKSARHAYLDEACDQDSALRVAVDSMLRAHDEAGSFGEAPAFALSGTVKRLAPDTQLGPFRIETLIGAGGMGEVYRAHDTKLQRAVAIKVLPDSFAHDADRRSRFEDEARVLAALNHPHIGAIYGVEESEDVVALVLELVDGVTLDERLAAGPIAFDDVLRIARQLAEGLEAAHDRGIVHRDFKPGNIKITPDGNVKILDFGLAKAAGLQVGAATLGTPGVSRHATQVGAVIGTAGYMSPEQARGQPVDKRTDIWAFGCVVYEMVTGNVAFPGATISDTIAAILERDPDWTALPAATPEPVRRLLHRCLEKDPKRRLRDIADASSIVTEEVPAAPMVPSNRRSTKAVWVLAAISAAVLAGFLLLRPDQNESRVEPIKFTFEPPENATLLREGLETAVSPDGTRVAFVAQGNSGPTSIWIRSMSSQESQRIEGTDNAIGPFWSPDGQFLGFFAQGKLKKVAVDGGPPQNICTTTPGLGATWSQTGEIVFNPINRAPLMRVSASGGTPQQLTTLDAGRHENSHRWPSFLPDGRHFLFTARSNEQENTAVYVGSLDSPETTRLLTEQTNAVYASPGYLLFGRQGTLMAQRFDADKIQLSGEAFPVAGNIDQETPSANAFFSVSKNGRVIAFHEASRSLDELTWFDREGKAQGTISSKGLYGWPRLSPDGRRLAVWMPDSESGNRDIWLVDVGNGTRTRFTSNPANDWYPEWSSDGAYVTFASDRTPRASTYRKAVGGDRDEELLVAPDGAPVSRWRTYPFVEGIAASYSQFGRWVAYQSLKSGTREIYVRSLEEPAEHRISTMGGAYPRWRGDGKELFYETPDNGMMAVATSLGESFTAATPKLLFHMCSARRSDSQYPDYEVTPDGNRFLFSCQAQENKKRSITVAIQWLDMVKDPRRSN